MIFIFTPKQSLKETEKSLAFLTLGKALQKPLAFAPCPWVDRAAPDLCFLMAPEGKSVRSKLRKAPKKKAKGASFPPFSWLWLMLRLLMTASCHTGWMGPCLASFTDL